MSAGTVPSLSFRAFPNIDIAIAASDATGSLPENKTANETKSHINVRLCHMKELA